MEKKTSNKSINKLIYAIMTAMLAVVIIVSVFTVSTRRRDKAADTSTDGVSVASDEDRSSVQSNIPDTDRSASVTSDEDDKTVNVADDTDSKTADAQSGDVSASKELRYFIIPVAGTVSKAFEIEVPVYSLTMNDYRAHTGVDIYAPLGSDVVAATSGTVCKVWNDPLMGCSVTIDHGDNIYTTYMNLAKDSSVALEVGQRVSMGEAIGTIGDSALIEIAEEPHLHLEMKVDGKYVDPLGYMGVSAEQDMGYED